MATTLTGSPVSADEIKKLQEKLINAGYDLGGTATGAYDDSTINAIKSYREANTGDADLTALYVGETAPDWLKNGTDQALPEAGSVGAYDAQLQKLYDQIVNREKFSYDVNEDLIYQQLKDQYTSQGEKAMEDTMGKASSLTGGYGNSYAQSVGQQQYNEYLQQLNENIPALYGEARDAYDNEGNKMQQLYALTSAARDAQYSKELDVAAQMAQYGDFSGYKSLYGEEKGKLMEDTWFMQNPDMALQLGLIDTARYTAITGIVPGQGGGGRVFDYFMGDGGTNYNPYNFDNANELSQLEVQQLQTQLGVTADGIWGPITEAAYNKKKKE